MLTLLISLFASAVTLFICSTQYTLTAYDAGWAVIAFLPTYFLVAFFVRKKSSKIQEGLQNIIEKGQNRLNRMVHQFQSKPTGNPANLQRQIDVQQKAMLQEALEYTVHFEPLKKWNLLMGRQIDTMRLQFHYQLKHFNEADELLATRSMFKGPMLMEPMSVAMKMARDYKNDDLAAAEKTFKKHIRWIRKPNRTLLYGLMSWIYVKNKDIDKAREVLAKGKEATRNEVLIRNWDFLSNDNVKKFSNAGLGEQWYALYLEKTPAPKQQRMKGGMKGRR